MGSRLRTGWILAVIGAVALVGACDLNPQPIPPGFTGGTDQSGDGGGNPTAATGSDSGGGGKNDDDDAGFGLDDGGDAGDAAEAEDASDSGDT